MKKITKTKSKTRYLILACLLGSVALFGNSLYIQSKAVLAQYLIQHAWEMTLKTDNPTPPWSWADTHPVAKFSVPRLNIEQYVLAGANGSPLAFAPGLYAGTKDLSTDLTMKKSQEKLPDTVIAGHHNTHFDFLKQLKSGEILYFENKQKESLRYQVKNIQTFDIRQQKLPAYFTGNTIQLVTCLPSYLGEIHPNQRLVVTLIRQG